MHDQPELKKGKKGSDAKVFDPEGQQRRAWIHLRMCEIHKDKYGLGAQVLNSEWAPCYQQAAKEWNEQERQKEA